MSRTNKLAKYISVWLIAVMIGASCAMSVMRAIALPINWLQAILPAMLTGLICTLAAISSMTFAVAGVGLVAWGALAAVYHVPPYEAVRALIYALTSTEITGIDALVGQEATIGAIIAVLIAALNYALIFSRRRGETGAAAALVVTLIIICNALSRTASLLDALPALLGCVAAYAQTAELQREGGFFRAFIPAAIATLLAFLLIPAQGYTYPPLEEAATRVRNIFEDYFSFTEERIAFSIAEVGYDHAGEVNGQLEPMLGGPAHLSEEPVMEVRSDVPVLLRGSIRRTYTGYSWTDTWEKARYLYYDLTRRSVRERVFDMNRLEGLSDADAFVRRDVAVRMLDSSTSTLFAANRLAEFDMTLENATYFNSVGEMFLSRNVQAGDAYSLKADVIQDRARLKDILAEAALRDDDRLQEMRDGYTQLPQGIEQGVYQLTYSLINGAESPYDAVQAIQYYLQNNCSYSLDVPVPPANRDFVSYFLLDAREGYCSYFASAMTVMCRIAGIPARYVEGYFAVPDDTGSVILTGRDAHAWVEVYFEGFGWMEFDPTTAARLNSGDGQGENGGSDSPEAPDQTPDAGDDSETPDAETPEPTEEPQDGQNDLSGEPTPEPSPTPPPFGAPEEENPPDDGESPQEDRKQDHSFIYWILLILLLAAIILALIYIARRRLRATDPIAVAGQQKTRDEAALVLYRACLTVLRELGHAPLSGETPEAFAERLAAAGVENPDFKAFSAIIARSRYAGQAVDKESLQVGARACRAFEQRLTRMGKWRYARTRIFRGLGNFEVIP